MADGKIRTGIVGAGNISDWHVATLRTLPDAQLAAVCDVSLSAAEALASANGVAAFGSLDDLIASGTCDAVHILTPPQFHRDVAKQALAAGLHCFVEKPIALTHADTVEIEEAARKAGRVLAVGHNFMGTPSYERLKARVAAGDLGRITGADICWHLPLAPLRSGPFGIWMLRETRNLLLELGPHLFGFAVDLFGPLKVEHLSVGKPIELPGGGGTRPQSWRVTARAGDVDVSITLSLVETTDDRSVVVRGSSGYARLDYGTDTLVVRGENASDVIVNGLRSEMSAAWQHLREGTVNAGRQLLSLNRKSPYGLSFRGVMDAFYTAIRNATEIDSRFSGASAVTVMKAIDETLALLPKEKPVQLPKPKRKPKPTVLVIGGTGFIGRCLTRTLVDRGYDVRVLSRGRTGPFDDLPEQVEVMSASLRDPDGLNAAMDGIDAVYHLGKSLDSTWEACLQNDVGVTVDVARAALDVGVKRFIYTGTIASYDMSDPGTTITEDTGFADDMTDRNLYARSKAECEKRLIEMHKNDGLPLTIARPGIVVGPGGPLQHWGIGRWHGAGAVRIWGHGKNTLPFVLNDDIADGLVKMMESDAAVGKSFNLIGEPMFSARDYFDAIHDELGAKIRVSSGNLLVFHITGTLKHFLKQHILRKSPPPRASYRDWKSRAHFSPFDNSQPKAVLGWQPETSQAEFIRRAVTQANLLGF